MADVGDVKTEESTLDTLLDTLSDQSLEALANLVIDDGDASAIELRRHAATRLAARRARVRIGPDTGPDVLSGR
jgi:hypothetical protein